MNQKALYLIIGLLIAGGIALGLQLYNERQKASHVEIDVGKNGISIEKK